MICDNTVQIDIRKLPKYLRPLPSVVIFDDIRLETTWTDTNFGGQRQWFLCPNCGRRCAIIYCPDYDPRWGCRPCLKGRYACEPLSTHDRRLHAAFKVRRRLGQTKGGIVAPFPLKPKGMHWRTYQDLKHSALLNELEILFHAQAELYRVTPDQVRDSFFKRLASTF